ncbi:MAG: hypothetical protein QNJ09_02445 [Paracoccaceae bacterium]|nr:hypothetical protein [Paracoccaceae bacterium]
MLMVILSIRILELTDSAFLVGVNVALRMGGSAFGALVAARLTRTVGLPRTLLGADVAAALILIVVAVLPAATEVYGLLLAGLVLGITFGVSNITMISVGPELVGRDQKHLWNGRIQAAQALAVVCSGLVTGLLYASGAADSHMSLAAAGFVLAGLLTSGGAPMLPDSGPSPAQNTGRLGFFRALSAGLPIVFALLVLARMGEALGSGVHNVGFPLLSAEYDTVNQALLAGWLLAAWGVGKTISGLALPPILRRFSSNGAVAMVFMGANILTFVFFMAIFQADALLFFITLALLAGLFDAATEISYYSCLQIKDRTLRDRLLSVSYMVERLALFTGILAAGYVLDRMPLASASALIYGVTIMLVAVAWVVFVFALRNPSARSASGDFNEI